MTDDSDDILDDSLRRSLARVRLARCLGTRDGFQRMAGPRYAASDSNPGVEVRRDLEGRIAKLEARQPRGTVPRNDGRGISARVGKNGARVRWLTPCQKRRTRIA